MTNNKFIAIGFIAFLIGGFILSLLQGQERLLDAQRVSVSELKNINVNTFILKYRQSVHLGNKFKESFKRTFKQEVKNGYKKVKKAAQLDVAQKKDVTKKSEVKSKKKRGKKKKQANGKEKEKNVSQKVALDSSSEEVQKYEKQAAEASDSKVTDDFESDFQVTGNGQESKTLSAAAQKKEVVPSSFEYWKNILVDSANTSATRQFINYFRAKHQSISASLFFKVLKAMVISKNSAVTELGYSAFSSTPSKANFIAIIELDQIASNEKRIELKSILNQLYTRPSQIVSLLAILNETFQDSAAQANYLIAGIDLLKKSAEVNLNQESSLRDPSEGSGQVSDYENTVEAVSFFLPLYQESIIRLQALSEHKITEVAKEAASTSALIQRLVSSFYESHSEIASTD